MATKKEVYATAETDVTDTSAGVSVSVGAGVYYIQ